MLTITVIALQRGGQTLGPPRHLGCNRLHGLPLRGCGLFWRLPSNFPSEPL